MVKRWMASPGHRANILNPSYTHLGVGIVRGIFNGEDAFYGTQNFAGKFMDIKDIFIEDDGEKWIIKIIVEKVNKNIEKKLFFEYKINNKRKIIYLENDNEVVKIIFDKNIGVIQIDGCFGSEYSWIITDTFYVNTSAKDVNNVIKINM